MPMLGHPGTGPGGVRGVVAVLVQCTCVRDLTEVVLRDPLCPATSSHERADARTNA